MVVICTGCLSLDTTSAVSGAQGVVNCPSLNSGIEVQQYSLSGSRHGARTPLTDSYWEGVRWEAGRDCGTLAGALQVAVTDMKGGPQPPLSHDAIQVCFYSQFHSALLVQECCQQHDHMLTVMAFLCRQARTLLPGGCTKGELTKPGQQQARELGRWLRQTYIDQYGFLPPDYRVRSLPCKLHIPMTTTAAQAHC